jgi:hypothetical protein
MDAPRNAWVAEGFPDGEGLFESDENENAMDENHDEWQEQQQVDDAPIQVEDPWTIFLDGLADGYENITDLGNTSDHV